MAILSREKYRQLTKDTIPEGAPLEESITLAQELLEDMLHRKLDEATVVDEVVVAYRQRYGAFLAFPKHMPVTDVTSPGWEYTNTGILKSASSGFSLVYNLDYIREVASGQYEVLVSYTGGFTLTTAPARLQLAIAKMTQFILSQNPEANVFVPGIKQMSVGGVQITLDTENLSSIIPPEVTKLARGYQRRQY